MALSEAVMSELSWQVLEEERKVSIYEYGRGVYNIMSETSLSYFVPGRASEIYHLPKTIINMLMRLVPTALRNSWIGLLRSPAEIR